MGDQNVPTHFLVTVSIEGTRRSVPYMGLITRNLPVANECSYGRDTYVAEQEEYFSGLSLNISRIHLSCILDPYSQTVTLTNHNVHLGTVVINGEDRVHLKVANSNIVLNPGAFIQINDFDGTELVAFRYYSRAHNAQGILSDLERMYQMNCGLQRERAALVMKNKEQIESDKVLARQGNDLNKTREELGVSESNNVSLSSQMKKMNKVLQARQIHINACETLLDGVRDMIVNHKDDMERSKGHENNSSSSGQAKRGRSIGGSSNSHTQVEGMEG